MIANEQISHRTDQYHENVLSGGNVERRGEPRVKPDGQERGGRRLIRLIFRWDLLGWGGGRIGWGGGRTLYLVS